MTNPVCPKCGTEKQLRHQWSEFDGLPKHLVCPLIPDKCRIKELEAQLEDADKALIEAVEHLEYCGYGDSWERECARDSGMIKRMDAAADAALARSTQRKEKP